MAPNRTATPWTKPVAAGARKGHGLCVGFPATRSTGNAHEIPYTCSIRAAGTSHSESAAMHAAKRSSHTQFTTTRGGLMSAEVPPHMCARRLPTTNGVNRIDHTSRQRCPPTPLQHYLIPRQIALSSMELFLPKTVPNPAHVCSANCTASLFQRPVLLRPPLPGAPSPSMQQRDSPSLIRARVRV